MIDWRSAQTKLAKAGYNPGPVDGIKGRDTFTALFEFAARRQADAVLESLGGAAASALPPRGIDATPARLANFMAQTVHESGGYTRFEESLRYSAKRLMAVWPSRFPTLASALPFAWDPSDPDREDVALANKTYGGRMGNEDDGTGDDDGWLYRGRGILQLTGLDQYAAADSRLHLGLVANPDLAARPAISLLIAADFWEHGRINDAVDRGDLKAARRGVNGGTVGLDDVLQLHARMLTVLA